ncbi:MAG: FliH/SctL family protein [Planctomycetota bacterium]|jgi:flagellar biosynthesis/type III secretory pathway protein FliH
MSGTIAVNLVKPIASAAILDGLGQAGSPASAGQAGVGPESGTDTAKFSHLYQALESLVAKLNHFCEQLFAEHKDQIAKLSVEIARKILVQKVQEGDYEIESIVKESLNNAPAHNDIVVHLNPGDLTQCQKLQQDNAAGALAGLKFVADPNIGRAECMLETPKGIIESLIDDHLEQIAKALQKAQ